MDRPMFQYHGSKWKLARDYLGPPRYSHVVEPFCGSAAFSCLWEPKKVTLIDKDPLVIGVWRFLQRVSPAEVLRLPSNISHVDQLPAWVPEEARNLIGFWFNKSLAVPAVRRCNWARQARWHASFWSKTVKHRLASQVDRVRHWTVIEGDWFDAPNVTAHWFIDPPYKVTGKSYRFNNIDYKLLAEWCKTRKGFTQVCEAVGAGWLPFEPLGEVVTPRHRYCQPGSSLEAVYEQENA